MIKPERLSDINKFFHTHVYLIQIENGAKLIGHWVNDTNEEFRRLFRKHIALAYN